MLTTDPVDSAIVESGWRHQVLEALEVLLARPSQVLRAHKALTQANVSQRQTQQQVETEQLIATWTHKDHWLAAASAFDKTHAR